MPKPNGKAQWATRTLDAAVDTAKDIMRGVSLDDYALTFGHPGAQWDNYMAAGRDATTVLIGAVKLVEHMEKQ